MMMTMMVGGDGEGDNDVDDENDLVTLVHIWAGGSDKFPEASSQLARTLIR